jgi:hypothetical protein
VLQNHPDVTIIVDERAAKLLEENDTIKKIFKRKDFLFYYEKKNHFWKLKNERY